VAEKVAGAVSFSDITAPAEWGEVLHGWTRWQKFSPSLPQNTPLTVKN
jgi:hypothetical protein